MKIRVKFAKYGEMKFIGYLDILRFFQKAIRRANIDIMYSQGYSPHQIMSFAAPLGVGIESSGEYFDMEVNSYTTLEDMTNQLNQVMCTGMEVISMTLLPDNTKNAMASIAAARYFVWLREGYETPFSWEEQLADFMEQEEILVTKQTKKSEREINVKPLIYEAFCRDGGIEMLVDASSAANIKPTLVMKAFYEANGATLGEFDVTVLRMELYGRNEDGTGFCPLEEFGSSF